MRNIAGFYVVMCALGCTSVTSPPIVATDSGTTTPPSNECRFDETRCNDEKLERCVDGKWLTLKECSTPCIVDVGCEGTTPPTTLGALSFIWVSNSAEGTLSKVDTRRGLEVARYRTCPFQRCDPSRTSVNLFGDVAVTNRTVIEGGIVKPSSTTKFAANPEHCIDRNGNGIIDSSTGPEDVRPWLQDECMLWNSTLPEGKTGARGTAWDTGVDLQTGEGGSLWVGTCDSSEAQTSGASVFQLSGTSGEILKTIDVPQAQCVYGAVMDGQNRYWFIDIASLKLFGIELESGDVREASLGCGYGITADSQSRIWVSGMCGAESSKLIRFSPESGSKAEATLEDAQVFSMMTRGIAIGRARSVGHAWTVGTHGALYKIEIESMKQVGAFDLTRISPKAASAVGVAVDFEGYVWIVAQNDDAIYKFDPLSESFYRVPVGRGPYTYSDMTGMQLLNVGLN